MKATVIRPGQMPFNVLRKGQLFHWQDDVYIKTGDSKAVVVYKSAGQMNEGESVDVLDGTIILRVAEVSFTLG